MTAYDIWYYTDEYVPPLLGLGIYRDGRVHLS